MYYFVRRKWTQSWEGIRRSNKKVNTIKCCCFNESFVRYPLCVHNPLRQWQLQQSTLTTGSIDVAIVWAKIVSGLLDFNSRKMRMNVTNDRPEYQPNASSLALMHWLGLLRSLLNGMRLPHLRMIVSRNDVESKRHRALQLNQALEVLKTFARKRTPYRAASGQLGDIQPMTCSFGLLERAIKFLKHQQQLAIHRNEWDLYWFVCGNDFVRSAQHGRSEKPHMIWRPLWSSSLLSHAWRKQPATVNATKCNFHPKMNVCVYDSNVEE